MRAHLLHNTFSRNLSSIRSGPYSFVNSVERIGPEVIKLFSCSAQLCMKFIMLINVKLPTIVDILIFLSMLNTSSKSSKAGKVFEQLKRSSSDKAYIFPS